MDVSSMFILPLAIFLFFIHLSFDYLAQGSWRRAQGKKP